MIPALFSLSHWLERAHILLRKNPCWGMLLSGWPNCGKTNGMPPRMAFDPSRFASRLRKRHSRPPASTKEVTVAPKSQTVAVAPDAEWDMVVNVGSMVDYGEFPVAALSWLWLMRRFCVCADGFRSNIAGRSRNPFWQNGRILIDRS